MVPYIILVYGLLVIVGGVMGYVKAQSRPSLISGSAFGVLLLGSAWLMLREIQVGWYLALALSIFLSAFFGYRFKNTNKFMPAGLMLALSLIALLLLLFARW